MSEHWSKSMAKFHPCSEARYFMRQYTTPQLAWDACPNAGWMLWALAKLNHREAVRVACLCARTVLKHIPANELRPLHAIEIAEAWVNEKSTLTEVREAGELAAYAAYELQENGFDAAAYATDAAAYACSSIDGRFDAPYAADSSSDAAYAIMSILKSSKDRNVAAAQHEKILCELIRESTKCPILSLNR